MGGVARKKNKTKQNKKKKEKKKDSDRGRRRALRAFVSTGVSCPSLLRSMIQTTTTTREFNQHRGGLSLSP